MSKKAFYRYIIALLIGALSLSEGRSLDLSKVEFNYLYKNTNANFDYKIAEKDGIYRVLLDVELRKVGPKDAIEGFEISSQRKFTSNKSIPVELLTSNKVDKGNIASYDYTFKLTNPEHTFLVILFQFLSKPYVIDIPVGKSVTYPYPDFLFKNIAGPKRVIKQSDSLIFESIESGTFNYHGYLYKDDLKATTPPFSDVYVDVNKKFEIMREDRTSLKYQVLDKNYLFYFQNDTSSKSGISFYSQREYFPRSKEFEELIGPLIYISTEQEFEKLTNARNKKLAFDNFWLSIIPSNKLAARTLRNYYARVQKASAMFSDYKDGWKTDRGMIYILFGAPDEVRKEEDQEMWTYNGFNGRLNFTFAKVPNLLTRYHYSLERNKKYSNTWYWQVDKWRKGDS